MLIGYFADGKWAHKALDLIIASDKIEVAFICARYNNPDPILLEKANSLGIDFLVEKDINNSDFQEILKKYNCDLFVSMSFNQIFRESTYTIPKKGSINCHAGKLPLYRGRNVLNWALINDEKEFGITVHYIDDGIDTGDIILQKTFQINEIDTYQSLLNKAYEECPKLLFESLRMIINNKLTLIPQRKINKSFMYCSKRIEGDEIINWNQNSRDIFNFVRGISVPGPCAQTFIKDSRVFIIKSKYLSYAPKYIGIPGTVLEVGNDYFYVKTRDSYIKITEWKSHIKIYTGLRFNKKV